MKKLTAVLCLSLVLFVNASADGIMGTDKPAPPPPPPPTTQSTMEAQPEGSEASETESADLTFEVLRFVLDQALSLF